MEEDKGKVVERSREEFEPVVGMATELTRYDRLVEDAVAEKIADEEGLPKDMTARVIVSKAPDGVPQLHIFGRNAEAVDAVADGVRSRTREVYRRYIGNRADPEEEAATIRPMLADIISNMPPTIGTLEDIMREAKGLPLVETPALTGGVDQAVNGLGEALEGFSPGKQTREELEEKEKSQDE
ncbi:hypothetical protein ES703_34231 [subsurface metagenome]